MVQEQLREEGEILTIDRVFAPVDLKNSHLVLLIAVDLIARRVVQRTPLAVPLQLHLQREEAQAEIADVEAVKVVVIDGVGTEVPGVGGVLT